MRLVLVAAMDMARGIGLGGGLPWRLPRDLRRFKSLSLGKPLIVGRKTYQSIGRPLEGRQMIIVSRDAHFSAPGCLVTPTIDEALAAAAQTGKEEAIVGGGSAIYQAVLARADRLALTLVLGHFGCDTFFPDLWEQGRWNVRTEAFHAADEQNPHPCVFLDVERLGA